MIILGYAHLYKRKIRKRNKRKFIEQYVFDILPEFKSLLDYRYLEYKYKESRQQSIIKL